MADTAKPSFITRTKKVALDLRACPFCGGRDLELSATHTPARWIECQTCGGRRDSCRGERRAANRWNELAYGEVSLAIVPQPARYVFRVDYFTTATGEATYEIERLEGPK